MTELGRPAERRTAAFHFKSRGLVLKAPLSDPAPERVLLSVAIVPPASDDYFSMTSAEVPFRFAGVQRGGYVYEVDTSPDPRVGSWGTAQAFVYMASDTARRLHVGQL